MTFDNKNMQYRVTLNTDLNLFIVFDKNDKNHVATGVTIEKAVQELQKTKYSECTYHLPIRSMLLSGITNL